MDKLYQYQDELLTQIDDRYFRTLFGKLDWRERMFGITGLRGTGKTTLLLQYLKYKAGPEHALYVSADNTWFYENTLVDLAEQFVRYGGKHLFIDEIHKYPRWSRELKNIYDTFPALQIVFTSSSLLDILKGESDLSRRALTYELSGLSFREYIEFNHQIKLPAFDLEDILKDTRQVVLNIENEIKPLPLFRQYLLSGYFPFTASEKETNFLRKLNQIIDTVLESDLRILEGYTSLGIVKIKKLLGVIAESAPFEPNISKIAQKLHLGRDTVKTYLQDLHKARLLNLISYPSRGMAALQKPDKIYLENTNLSYALKDIPEKGTLRETFFINQLRNAGYSVELGKEADFLVDEKWNFEIGGPSKDGQQIQNSTNAYLVLDELENAYLNRIPLWLSGFLY